jgi:hypothetical protein
LKALKDKSLIMGRAEDAIGDINLSLNWNIGKNALNKSNE